MTSFYCHVLLKTQCDWTILYPLLCGASNLCQRLEAHYSVVFLLLLFYELTPRVCHDRWFSVFAGDGGREISVIAPAMLCCIWLVVVCFVCGFLVTTMSKSYSVDFLLLRNWKEHVTIHALCAFVCAHGCITYICETFGFRFRWNPLKVRMLCYKLIMFCYRFMWNLSEGLLVCLHLQHQRAESNTKASRKEYQAASVMWWIPGWMIYQHLIPLPHNCRTA